jgi:hypothetical protein
MNENLSQETFWIKGDLYLQSPRFLMLKFITPPPENHQGKELTFPPEPD